MVMPISFLLQQQDQEEVPDQEVEDPHRTDSHAPEPEVQRSLVPDMSPPSPPLPTLATAPADTPGPSYTAQHSPEYVHVSSRKIAGVMDAVCSLASTQASMDQRLTRAETTLEDCHSMLQQIMSHLGHGCCLFVGIYTGLDGPEVDSSGDYSRGLSFHAPADHESPRSPTCSCPAR